MICIFADCVTTTLIAFDMLTSQPNQRLHFDIIRAPLKNALPEIDRGIQTNLRGFPPSKT